MISWNLNASLTNNLTNTLTMSRAINVDHIQRKQADRPSMVAGGGNVINGVLDAASASQAQQQFHTQSNFTTFINKLFCLHDVYPHASKGVFRDTRERIYQQSISCHYVTRSSK